MVLCLPCFGSKVSFGIIAIKQRSRKAENDKSNKITSEKTNVLKGVIYHSWPQKPSKITLKVWVFVILIKSQKHNILKVMRTPPVTDYD